MNTIYENEIIENKMTELLNTRLDTRALMSVDTSLSENAGLRKVINRYTYKGRVENLEKGEKNSVKGTVSFVPEYYDVKRYQQTFEYNDMDAMADPYIVDVAMQGAVSEISNEINSEYFTELSKIGTKFAYEGESVTYADIVDALGSIDCEVNDGLFIIMGAKARKALRKDPDFIASKQGEIVYGGQFGTICGIPVLYSKLIKDGRIIVTNKDAVRFFVKKNATVEQARDIETKDNTVVYERHGLIALVDDTSSVQLGKKPGEFTDVTYTDKGSYVEASGYDQSLIHLYRKNAPVVFEGEELNPDEWVIVDGETTVQLPKGYKGDSITFVKLQSNSFKAERISVYYYGV
jgi:hypothetical protein